MISRNYYCPWCRTDTDQNIMRRGTSNNFHLGYFCVTCNRPVPHEGTKLWVKKQEVIDLGEDPEETPWHITQWDTPRPECVVCGMPSDHEHHFAPRWAFPDTCEQWPKAWLCLPCHTLWHKTVDRWGKAANEPRP